MAHDLGYIRLWRKLQKSDVWDMPPEALKLFLFLLLNATHKPVAVRINKTGKEITLQPGQLIISMRQISKRLSIPTSNIFRHFSELKMAQVLEHKVEHKKTLVTLTNWAKYQPDTKNVEQYSERFSEQYLEQKSEKSGTVDNIIINKNVFNKNKEKEINKEKERNFAVAPEGRKIPLSNSEPPPGSDPNGRHYYAIDQKNNIKEEEFRRVFFDQVKRIAKERGFNGES